MRLFKPKIFQIPSALVPTVKEVENLDIYCLSISKDGRKRPKMTFEYTEKNNRFILRNHVNRFYGIDAPEIRGEERPEGLIAKGMLMKWVPVGSQILLRTHKDSIGLGRSLFLMKQIQDLLI